MGSISLDFSDNAHLTDIGQTRLLHALLLQLEENVFQRRITLEKAVLDLFESMSAQGLEKMCSGEGGMSQIRPLDFAHALNRLRLLKILPEKE